MHTITYPVEVTKTGTFLAEALINGRRIVVEAETENEALQERSFAMLERLRDIRSACELAKFKAAIAFLFRVSENPYPLGSFEAHAFNEVYQRCLKDKELTRLMTTAGYQEGAA